jgi:predicted Zn-dependent protease with MMP-like domain
MFVVDENLFEKIVGEALDGIPEKYQKAMSNVAFVIEDQPNVDQRQKLALRHDQRLFGLYEGIPLTKRGGNYTMVLPDKITLFRLPIEYASNSIDDLKERVRHTVWHELAHHFGLSHQEIYALE